MGKCINTNDLELEVSHYLQCEKESEAITLEELKEIINRLPSADVAEVKHGEWIIKKTTQYREKITYRRKQIAHCPYCGHMEDRTIPKFCSECGADMRQGDNDV